VRTQVVGVPSSSKQQLMTEQQRAKRERTFQFLSVSINNWAKLKNKKNQV
jgi:hypothetical protein